MLGSEVLSSSHLQNHLPEVRSVQGWKEESDLILMCQFRLVGSWG